MAYLLPYVDQHEIENRHYDLQAYSKHQVSFVHSFFISFGLYPLHGIDWWTSFIVALHQLQFRLGLSRQPQQTQRGINPSPFLLNGIRLCQVSIQT
jgi:hypothetical protein